MVEVFLYEQKNAIVRRAPNIYTIQNTYFVYEQENNQIIVSYNSDFTEACVEISVVQNSANQVYGFIVDSLLLNADERSKCRAKRGKDYLTIIDIICHYNLLRRGTHRAYIALEDAAMITINGLMTPLSMHMLKKENKTYYEKYGYVGILSERLLHAHYMSAMGIIDHTSRKNLSMPVKEFIHNNPAASGLLPFLDKSPPEFSLLSLLDFLIVASDAAIVSKNKEDVTYLNRIFYKFGISPYHAKIIEVPISNLESETYKILPIIPFVTNITIQNHSLVFNDVKMPLSPKDLALINLLYKKQHTQHTHKPYKPYSQQRQQHTQRQVYTPIHKLSDKYDEINKSFFKSELEYEEAVESYLMKHILRAYEIVTGEAGIGTHSDQFVKFIEQYIENWVNSQG